MRQATALTALADRIELWPIDRLRPYERNPRTHSEAQVDQIAASMVEFGWTNPILMDEGAGILAGHGRLLAARKLGLAEVPVIRFEHLSEAQKRAYIVDDNQIALQAGWDDALLAEELAWLRDERFDLNLVGFDATELERLLAIADGETARDETEDQVPEPPEDPVSKPGDLWVLGNHRLLCGDATVLADVERLLDGQLADIQPRARQTRACSAGLRLGLKPAITSMTTALAPASMVIQDGTSRSSAAAGPSPPARSSQTIRVRAWRNPVLL
jgi:ParB-like chromosome segregation protein Spo0J